MERRKFLRNAALGGIAMAGVPGVVNAAKPESSNLSNSAQFKLKYAPGLGAFREHAGDDIVDQIQFIHDQGFRAIFDNGLMGRPAAQQELIANELAKRNMDLGPFVLYADFRAKSMVLNDEESRDMLKGRMEMALELRNRTNIKQALVVPGRYDERLAWDYQTANVIDCMRMCCDIVGPSGLVLVLEPLNGLRDHPGLFLTTMPQSYMICKAVEHPSCRIVNDIYHQQITEGNLIPNIDAAWEYIASFHVGDNPGRREPTTGEINFKNIFKHLYNKNYDGVICMEHGRSLRGIEGEKALIAAYREVDSFETE